MTKNEKHNEFENHLIPSIQVKNELRFYNINNRMQYYDVPGLAIAIIKKGEIIFSKGYGFAQLKDSVKVNNNTVFQAGSLSKSITAVTVMRLVEKGILDLDTNIDEYLKTWKFPKSKYRNEKPITLRNLLSHTAGVKNNNHFGFAENEKFPTINELLNGYKNYKRISMDTIPGARYKYSNTGYAVLEKIIEDVTKKSFQQVVSEKVFIPFGMTNSSGVTRTFDKEDKQTSYAFNNEGKRYKEYWFNAANKASGGIWTSAEDLARFIIKFQKILKGKNSFISSELANKMLVPVKAKYGLGFDIKLVKDSTIFYHTGKNRGFTNIMMGMQDTSNGIVVLTNADNGGYLFMEIVRGVSELNNWNFSKPKVLETITVSKETLETYKGVYKATIDGDIYSLEIELEGKHLKLIDLDQEDVTYPLRAVTKTKFRDINDGEKVDFITNDKGEIMLLWDETFKFEKQNVN
ncbi:hypothetical protein BTO18_12830 [Polaribacter porphyrae]|uniref:Beta-lactamase-related domain-containing protein n=1 Tax=Polaribacter porphyrae TaxID=1137780 RepID=A0A2S7WQX7_9FLAO|nr:hypothetical protein BTO18_12830 [Polaribacter porphyrae]